MSVEESLLIKFGKLGFLKHHCFFLAVLFLPHQGVTYQPPSKHLPLVVWTWQALQTGDLGRICRCGESNQGEGQALAGSMQDGPLPAISRVMIYNSTYRPFIRSFIGISHISLFNYSGHIFVYKMWFTFYEGIPIVLAFTIHYEPVFGQSRSHGENFRKHFAFVQDTQKHFFF